MKLNAHKTARGTLTVAGYVEDCINTGTVPESQAVLDAVLDDLDSQDTQRAMLIACLLLDWQPIRDAGLKLAQVYGVSSREVKALRTAVGKAGREAAEGIADGEYTYRYKVAGVDLTRLTIAIEKQKGKPIACTVKEAAARKPRTPDETAKAKGSDEPNKAQTETRVKLSPEETILALLREYGFDKVDQWVTAGMATIAAEAEAKAFPDHKAPSKATH